MPSLRILIQRMFFPLAALSLGLVILFLTNYRPRVSLHGNSDFYRTDFILLYKGTPFNGQTVETFPDGSTFRTTNYRAGIKNGVSEEFAKSGAIRHQRFYKNGLLHGLQKGWFTEGPLMYNHHYKAGLLHGEMTQWNLNGSIATQKQFISGKQVDSKIKKFRSDANESAP